MKLIRKLGTRIINGRLESWGLFKCPDSYCGKEVEKSLGNGLKANSCGCQPKNFKHGESNKKRTKIYILWMG